MIHGRFTESLRDGGKPDYRTFPGALLSSIFSLLSGASVDPEGTITVLIGYVSSAHRERLMIDSPGPRSDSTLLPWHQRSTASSAT